MNRSAKKFDQGLYNTNDDAKHLVIRWLGTQGYDAWVNPDDYGIDLIGISRITGIQSEFEVEVKHNWSGSEFPFGTVHIPARKLKFVSPTSYFVIVNHERTHLLILRASRLTDAPVVRKSTIYTTDEQFVEIPYDDFFLEPIEGADHND